FALVMISSQQSLAQGPENVLLIVNETSAASVEIGDYYAAKRSIPRENILRLRPNAGETIERADYERQIEGPIANWLMRNFAQDRILYIVLTKGIPLRISGTGGQDGTVASVDSELTLIYRRLAGPTVQIAGRTNNPYFRGDSPGSPKQFTHEVYDI